MKRILSGMRPTGKLHLGHLVGVLKQWVELQEQYECFYMIADLHAMTSEYQNYPQTKQFVEEVVMDWLAVGIDPEKAVVFLQSDVPEHAELYTLLGMITPLGWLERNPTYKEQKQQMKDKDLNNLGFFAYPVLQAADILIYKAELVPIGKDQQPHLEMTREIARRFNYLYGDTFPEPQALLSEIPSLGGIDGRKMSKSYGNAIYISDSPDEIRQKISRMFTDTKRIRRTDPGHPDECNVFPYYLFFARSKGEEFIKEVRYECENAQIGCVQCKKRLAEIVVEYLKPIQEKRKIYEKDRSSVYEILKKGAEKARDIASQTMKEVRERLKLGSDNPAE